MSKNKVSIKIKGSTQWLVESCQLANSAHKRLVGLLNHSKLNPGEGLLLDPCNQVHTLFMRFAIDAVFLDRHNHVVHISELKPWRISKLCFSARRVLELPLGTCRSTQLKIGDSLEVQSC